MRTGLRASRCPRHDPWRGQTATRAVPQVPEMLRAGVQLWGEQGAWGRVLRAPEVEGGPRLVRGGKGTEEAESGGKGS